MTHNTREVEEKKYPSHKELDMEKYYRIVKSGNFDNMFNYGFDVGKAFHQQELQKAREERVDFEAIKWGYMKLLGFGLQNTTAENALMMDRLRDFYQE